MHRDTAPGKKINCEYLTEVVDFLKAERGKVHKSLCVVYPLQIVQGNLLVVLKSDVSPEDKQR